MSKFGKIALLTLVAFFVLGVSITVNADAFLVPDDFTTIQEAVDAAHPIRHYLS